MFWQNTSRLVLPERLDGADPAAPGYVPEAGYELSVVECPADPFTELVVSWNADTPEATSVRVEARLRYAPADAEPEAAAWSAWRVLGHWGRGGQGGRHCPAAPATRIRRTRTAWCAWRWTRCAWPATTR